MKKKKYVVTGGAGFIGSHIVDALVERGGKVIVIDNESSTVHDHYYYNKKAKYYKLDVSNYKKTNKLYKGVDCVFHCAAQARIMSSIENPIGAFQTNVIGTATVLECARKHKVRRVVYSSTSSAYGLKNKPPFREDAPVDCLNPYSVSKIAGEDTCKVYSSIYELSTIALRYFNVYGEREPIRGPYAPLIGLFLRQHRANEPLTIVPDGHQRRDFTYVKDVVNANLLACDSETVYHDVFNVGSGVNFSVLEIANIISNNTKFIEVRPGEARETLANTEKIKSLLGWNPQGDLETYIKNELAK